jgi:isoquinoline 1-oxidoreductase beta subunit
MAGASLLLPFSLRARALMNVHAHASAENKAFAPNAWLEISSNNEVRIWCGKSEMGQGVRTSLPMIVAEELGCDWRNVQVHKPIWIRSMANSSPAAA